MTFNSTNNSTSNSKADFLSQAHLYVLLDAGDYWEDANCPKLQQLTHSLVAAGVHLIQLRDKRLNDRQLLDCGLKILRLTRGSGTQFIMNDRADLARLVDADGVHLGQADIELKDAAKILGPDKIVGISTHSLQQAREATAAGADYIGVGPVFPSTTKNFDSFVGLELLGSIAKATSSKPALAPALAPAFAIGGITLANVDQVIATGTRRIAVSSVLCRSAEPQRTAAELLKKLRSA